MAAEQGTLTGQDAVKHVQRFWKGTGCPICHQDDGWVIEMGPVLSAVVCKSCGYVVHLSSKVIYERAHESDNVIQLHPTSPGPAGSTPRPTGVAG